MGNKHTPVFPSADALPINESPTPFAQLEMNRRTVVALLTLLLLLLAEQLTYGLFYSDLSFITASFFPDVGTTGNGSRDRWTRRGSAITRGTL